MTTNANDLPLVLTVAVLGGTGKEGSGLAMRWARSGYRVVIGSRDANKAMERAGEMNTQLGVDYLIGKTNDQAAAEANIAVLTVPYSAHRDTLEAVKTQLQGKILVDIVVPMQPSNIRTVFVPEGKSAALEAQEVLGVGVRVVSAFENVSAVKLQDPNSSVNCDVLVCGDDADAKSEVMHLVEAAGMRGIDAGPLANSVAVEALTPVLLYINKKYGVKGSGIRITGM